MALEPDVQPAVDAVVGRLRDSIESDIRGLADELMTVAARDASEEREPAPVSRLLDSVRRLDAQTTLTAILDTLTDLVATEVERVALFVETNGEMRGWRFAGFDADLGEPRSRGLTADDAGFVSRAIGERQTRLLPAAGERGEEDRPPEFAEVPADRTAVAVPVLIGGEVMAVVYADDVSADRPAGASGWPDAVELLARHAAHRLEALTAERAVALAHGVMPEGLDRPVEPAPDAAG